MNKAELKKLDIIPEIQIRLKEDGILDLTGWVDTYCNETDEDKKTFTYKHKGFVRSVAYRMEKLGIVEVIPVEDWNRFFIKELRSDKKYPFWHAFKVGTANTLLSLIVGIFFGLLIARWQKTSQASTSSKIPTTTKMICDSVTKILHEKESHLPYSKIDTSNNEKKK